MYEDLLEKKISSEKIFDGVLLHVRRDTVELPNGNKATREWIEHPGASSVLPILPDGRLLFVRQYRYPVDKVTLEVPAGKIDAKDEDPLVCAQRELSEETGYTAERIERLTTLATTVGFSNEFIHMYVADGLQPGQQHTDPDEFINVVKLTLDEALQKIFAGEIIDAKTIASVLMYDRRLHAKA